MPRDPAKAFRWYLEAAQGGHPDAQFNVAVMLDSGVGAPESVAAASVWYARSAANGHPRAQYNLGLIYEKGEGVPRNPDLARYWLTRAAASLPAAEERLQVLEPAAPADRAMTAPVGLSGALVPLDGTLFAELTWTSAPGPRGIPFLVEVVGLPAEGENWGTQVLRQTTEASSLTVELPNQAASYAWRVSRVGRDGSYAAAPWVRLGDGEGSLPERRVTLRVRRGDAAARRLAEETVGIFDRCCVWTRIETQQSLEPETVVRYAFDADRAFAGALAEFLPVIDPDEATEIADPDILPGEIAVALVGGPVSTE